MTKRARRRFINFAIFAAATATVIVLERLLWVLHWRTSFVTGWILITLVVFLALYNFRKKLNVVAIGNSATWLQLHIYAGLLTAVVFALHIGMRIPNGTFECFLAMMYAGTFLSGVGGLILSRTLPGRLTSRGEEVLFERIPIFLKQLRDEVEQIVFKSVEQTETTAIPELYLSHLKPFFEGPRNSIWHLMHSNRPRKKLLMQITGQQRFLSDDERDAISAISDRVQRKDDLDYQYALQGTLKLWLFIHIPLTYGLLVMSVFHGLAVYAYGGGS